MNAIADVDAHAAEEELLSAIPQGCYVDGVWRSTAAGAEFDVEDPSDQQVLAHVADARAEDAKEAVDAAARAQDSWASLPARARCDLLRAMYDEVVRREDDFALLITLEMGKPLAESRGEVRYAADYLRWFSEQGTRVGGEFRPSPDGASMIATLKAPVGPSLLITPWNFPLAMLTRKLGPALAAGCSTVVKPAEDTPLTALLLAQVAHEVGIPPGVVNVIPTSEPAPLVEEALNDPRIRKVSFTGSTPVGKLLLGQAAVNVTRTSMELGGNGVFVVFDDADLDAAVDGAMVAKMRNGGQSCVAANRFLVAESVADAFSQALAERMAANVLGPGVDPASTLGPLINGPQRDRVVSMVAEAADAGAQVLTGGQARDGAGYFYEPTVLTGVPVDARLGHEEVFGPVAPIFTFSAEADALRLANDTRYGLAAFIYTRDIGRALRVSKGLDVGMVGINRGLVSNAAAPFGGVKESGLGREGGFEGIEEYLDTKYLAVDQPGS